MDHKPTNVAQFKATAKAEVEIVVRAHPRDTTPKRNGARSSLKKVQEFLKFPHNNQVNCSTIKYLGASIHSVK